MNFSEGASLNENCGNLEFIPVLSSSDKVHLQPKELPEHSNKVQSLKQGQSSHRTVK